MYYEFLLYFLSRKWVINVQSWQKWKLIGAEMSIAVEFIVFYDINHILIT